jgi:hypothetical protein
MEMNLYLLQMLIAHQDKSNGEDRRKYNDKIINILGDLYTGRCLSRDEYIKLLGNVINYR